MAHSGAPRNGQRGRKETGLSEAGVTSTRCMEESDATGSARGPPDLGSVTSEQVPRSGGRKEQIADWEVRA